MKHLRRERISAVLLCSLSAVFSSAVQPACAQAGLSAPTVSISTDKATYARTELPVLTVTLTNPGKDTIRVAPHVRSIVGAKLKLEKTGDNDGRLLKPVSFGLTLSSEGAARLTEGVSTVLLPSGRSTSFQISPFAEDHIVVDVLVSRGFIKENVLAGVPWCIMRTNHHVLSTKKKVERFSHGGNLWVLRAPGTFSLRLIYQYSADATLTSVPAPKKRIKSAPVTFAVQ